MRHPLARLLDLVVGDGLGQMCQVDQLLRIRRRTLLQERGRLVPPRGYGAPVPPPGAVSVDPGQQHLEDVLTEDHAVPAVGLQGYKDLYSSLYYSVAQLHFYLSSQFAP